MEEHEMNYLSRTNAVSIILNREDAELVETLAAAAGLMDNPWYRSQIDLIIGTVLERIRVRLGAV